jgi:hypothetical protein
MNVQLDSNTKEEIYRGSIFWKAIVQAFKSIGNNLGWLVGDGRSIRSTTESWFRKKIILDCQTT